MQIPDKRVEAEGKLPSANQLTLEEKTQTLTWLLAAIYYCLFYCNKYCISLLIWVWLNEFSWMRVHATCGEGGGGGGGSHKSRAGAHLSRL